MQTSFGELVGQDIREAREARGWTQLELAERAFADETKERRIRELETGKVARPQAKNLTPICDALGITRERIAELKAQVGYVQRPVDTAAEGLVEGVEALTERLKISEALAVALAYKYAEGNPTDLEGALAGLEAALETYAKERDRGALPLNLGEDVDEIVRRIDALNELGDVDAAIAELEADLARRRAERERRLAEDIRVLEKAIVQATMTRNAERLAARSLELVRLEAPGAEDQFLRLRGLQDERYEEGLRQGVPFALEAAIGLARTAAEIAPTPYLRATAQNDLGIALQTQGNRTAGEDGARLLAEAVAAYRAALCVRTEADHPVDWARTMMNLASALATQGSRTAGEDGARLLAEAVAAYREALRVRTEAEHPVGWARTMQNLAAALRKQGSRVAGEDGARLLTEAVAAYRDALRVFTEAEHPVDWATTMQNLGLALQTQGSRTAGEDGARLLTEAVAAYRHALRVRTEADYPVDWATTMQNLGLALQTQGSRTAGEDGARLLTEAVAAYRDALRVRTEADYPVDWAMTQENLAIAEKARAEHESCTDPRAHWAAALEHVEAALRVYDPETMSYDYETAVALREEIRGALAADAA